MVFASWTFNGFLLDIIVTTQEGDETNYVSNGEWHLVKLVVERMTTTYSCCAEFYPGLFLKLFL